MFQLTPTTLASVEPLITVNEAHCVLTKGKRSRMALVWTNDAGDIRIDAPADASGMTLDDAKRGLLAFDKIMDALKESELSAYVAASGSFIGRVPAEYWCTIEPMSADAHFMNGKELYLSEKAFDVWAAHTRAALNSATPPTPKAARDAELAKWAKDRASEGVPSRAVNSDLIRRTWLGYKSKAPSVETARDAVKRARGNPGPGRPKANDNP